MEETKKCPACAEDIKIDAIKCRYCWEDLTLTEKDKIIPKVIDVWSFSTSPYIICPECNYEWKAKQIMKWSWWITLILLFLYIIPGLIYWIWRGKPHWWCPKCKNIIVKKVN
jgi:ssDNA-binding Zn-finger/Zn-ribbon topoisomerase 1